jgi:hypothetical protein
MLGPFILEESEGAAALAITLDDVSVVMSVAHARLALLQAVTSLFASLGRYAPARKLLMKAEVAQQLLQDTVQVGHEPGSTVTLQGHPPAPAPVVLHVR